MKTKADTRPIMYDAETFRISIEMLLLSSVAEDFLPQGLVKQLAEDLSRLPKITLEDLVELLAQGRSITLDPDILKKITRKIAREITNPCIQAT